MGQFIRALVLERESMSAAVGIIPYGASNAAIVSGLVAFLLRVYSGRISAEIIATDPAFFRDLGLLEAL